MVAAPRASFDDPLSPPGAGQNDARAGTRGSLGRGVPQTCRGNLGVADLREAVEAARHDLDAGKRTVVFIDEIHRWNRAQQDAFLPHVESGLITLIGATTENPGSRSSRRCSRGCGCSCCIRSRTTSRHWCIARSPTRSAGSADRAQAGGRRDRRDSSKRRRRRAPCARHAGNCRRVRAGGGRNTAITPERIGRWARREALLRWRGRGALQRHLGLHQEHLGSDPDTAVYWMIHMLEAGGIPCSSRGAW